MPAPLPDDIIERIRQDFAPHEADEAIRLLGGRDLGARSARCVLLIANGNSDELRKWVDIADLDYRSVIAKAEYDGGNKRLRDLNSSFLIDSPEKSWISAMAGILDSRGFRLIDLQSRLSKSATNKGRVSSDYEGVATFVGGTGTIKICLEDRKWTLIDDSADLGVYGLDVPSDDSSWFHEAVSRFTAMKARGLHVRRDSC